MNSLLFLYPAVADKLALAAEKAKSEGWTHRLVVYLRTFGAKSAKPLELRGHYPALGYLGEIHRRCWPCTKDRLTAATMTQGTRSLF